MRKRVGNSGAGATDAGEGVWLDLESIAEVDVSSETPGHPVENALLPGRTGQWQAARTGAATITLRFDPPRTLTGTMLHFTEAEQERSQEWALSAVFTDGSRRELLRQGWNFSPSGSREQREQHVLNLPAIASLTLWIDPDRGRDRYPATLTAWRVAGT